MSAPTEDEDLDLVGQARRRLGATLGEKWTLERLLGIGGMGAVYAATHRNGRTAAIKMPHAHLALSPAMRRRFLREGRVANTVEHPGTVDVFDDGESDTGEPFLVMELLEGETLQAKGMGEAPPSANEAALLCAEVLDVLSAAHAKGVIHRDVKPENVFLTRAGRVKVLDFGIASFRDASSGESFGTRPGSARGTPAYMAPEQARGATDVDGRADVWSVGAILYWLASGRTVHGGGSSLQDLFLAGTQPAKPVRSVRASVPGALATVIDRALAFEPADRFATAAAMAEALRAAVTTVPSGDATRSPLVRPVVLLFVAICALVAAGVSLGARTKAPAAPAPTQGSIPSAPATSAAPDEAPPPPLVEPSSMVASAPPSAASAAKKKAGRAPGPGASVNLLDRRF